MHRSPILEAAILRVMRNDATFKAGYPCIVHDNVECRSDPTGGARN